MEVLCSHKEPSSYVSSNLTLLVVLSQAVKRGKREGYDVVLCDTSGRMVILRDLGLHIFTYLLLGKLLMFEQLFCRTSYKLWSDGRAGFLQESHS